MAVDPVRKALVLLEKAERQKEAAAIRVYRAQLARDRKNEAARRKRKEVRSASA